ncbi:Peptide methionine sulfoxide reductase msrA [Thalassoporum mexicanum PCC 7367]|uniref:peptide-methionine (S)-S-oxide reductase MsrA n=1 Tax=Thalassoporum mexicanum TaxID=3457544 RepID=UPI00029FEDE9|nr:peptide-methionine (S)-S-oxide reductase MsrA [Pseudanabaena sp. PCC 7367]AFY69453.1 Peptide methionine sulfoxide reductase msrA [Pseudanabaena sp. PCC 7367]
MAEIATFGAGCFWGVEAAFMQLKGVTKTSVGYMGGHFPNPCYLDVCARITGHAEVVQIEFDPQLISYQQLLDRFWQIHDPTALNRQGPDRGEQYRSVIFYHSPAQAAAAQVDKQRLDTSGEFDRPIVTFIEPASDYYLAAAEHQHYFAKRDRLNYQNTGGGDRTNINWFD